MKVLFAGLGSIGKRHLKNLVALAREMNIPLSVDALRHDLTKELPPEIAQYVEKQYIRTEDMPDYDIVFITNPTNLHYGIIKSLADKTDCFFIEKPIFEDGKYSLEKAGLRGKKAYVAAPMRWCKTYIELKKRIPQMQCYSARVICSSYLPEWRKGVDYRTVYSAHRDMGGGVTIDLIHEWDYLIDLFGFPLEYCNFKGKYSNLEIDSDDISVYIARYKDMLCEVHLDYIGRGYRRSIELLCADGNVTADFGEGKLTLADGTVIDCAEDVNERYLREMRYFLEYARGSEAQSVNSPEQALNTLRLSLDELD